MSCDLLYCCLRVNAVVWSRGTSEVCLGKQHRGVGGGGGGRSRPHPPAAVHWWGPWASCSDFLCLCKVRQSTLSCLLVLRVAAGIQLLGVKVF